MDNGEVGDVERGGENGSLEKDMSMIENGAQRHWRRGAAEDEKIKEMDRGGDTEGSSSGEVSQPCKKGLAERNSNGIP